MTGAEVFGAAAARAGLAWLLTYVVHGAIAGSGAEVLVRVAHPGPAAEHRLWKMALLLPLLTASLGALLGGGALGGAGLLEAPVVVRVPESPTIAAVLAPSYADAASGVALIVMLGIVAGAARFAIGLARVWRRLGDRRAPADPRLASSLARIAGRFAVGPIELTESSHLGSPTAVAARAVCFPAGRLGLLADAEVDAVLAHELAHLERRDPFWFLFAGLVQAALWMQPLNHRVAARLRRSAEFACDDRAVAATGDSLGLARALSRFAHAAFDAAPAAFPGAARSSSALVERVRRLAAGAPAAPSRALAVRSGAAAVLLASVALGSVNLTVAFARAPAASAAHVATALSRDVDAAAASRRAADLVSAEIRLEAQIDATRALAGGERANAVVSSRVLELEQELRHAREECAWLEQSVTDRIAQ